MHVQFPPKSHLTYCLNVHPGESWEQNFAAIREHTLAVRNAVSSGNAFGLGLRLSALAAETLFQNDRLEEFRNFLSRENLYVFTINGFPYGQFHEVMVKENVYAPDWRSIHRKAYTIRLADILCELLPDGQDGSISTVPGSFKRWIQNEKAVQEMVVNLVDTAAHLHWIHETTGREIHLGLEPEPSCFLETTRETIDFFEEALFKVGPGVLSRRHGFPDRDCETVLRRHLGVCLDTCHVALQFEDLAWAAETYRAHGIRISKCQLSAAVAVPADSAGIQSMKAFQEPVYLHQVKARCRENNSLKSWDDLPAALPDLEMFSADLEEIRVHFHVPLFMNPNGVPGTTGPELTRKAVEAVAHTGCTHFEIETYTFDVLPYPLRVGGVVSSIVREYDFVAQNLGITPPVQS